MIRHLSLPISLVCLLLSSHIGLHFGLPIASAQESLIEPYRKAAIERWEKDIQKFEELDQQETDPEHAILFTGSSSIRRWTSMAEDMAPWKTIRRGYGGARFSDLAVFIDRIVENHSCDAVVIFVANDISGSDRDKQPAEVLELYQYIVKRIHKRHPQTPIFCIAITPTSSRFDVWPQIKKVNQLIRDYCDSSDDNDLHFIETAEQYLNDAGKPRDELFVDDLLHLNEKGYDLWSEIIKESLASVLITPK